MTATSYSIGIDLGTTYTAAAVYRGGSPIICQLGSRGAVIPSLVFLRDDQEVLTGEAAERRGLVEPTRLAREFKRRVGDSAPIMLGQAPYSAERLMAALLAQVVAVVTAREGGEPDHVAVSHPANWGPFKIDLLRHALDLASLRSVTLLTEPVAAAVHYASKDRVGPVSVVAVYDLGGGTFDAAVLKKTETAFVTLGEPEGIERLGGIDFDEAVMAYVRTELQGKLEELDGSDPSIRVAMGRLRRECVAAKEGLSSDSETVIPVALPDVHTDIRLTRAEFEPMIKPAIGETIEALRRAIERAGVRPEDLDTVLLVGGSSQIPLVAQMVSGAVGRPVAVDAHPKHSVALGAAMVAATAAGAAASPPASSAGPAPASASVAPPANGTNGGLRASASASAATAPAPATPVAATPAPPSPDLPGHGGREGRTRRIAVAAAGIVLVGAATIGAYMLGSGKGDAQEGGAGSRSSVSTSAPSSTAAAIGGPTTAAGAPCASASGRCARITDISIDGDHYLAHYTVEPFEPLTPENGGTPDDHHVHFFLDTTSPEHAGTNSPDGVRGDWHVWDLPKGGGELRFDEATLAEAEEAGAHQLCVLVADATHGVEQSTGNCVDLPT